MLVLDASATMAWAYEDEVGLRLGIPLATLDQSLARAARAAQASLFQ